MAITIAAQVAVAVGGLLIYRLLSREKGTDGVAAYALVKQLVVFVWPLVMIGMQTAIPRYVALARDRAGAVEAHLLAALWLTGAAAGAACAALLVAPSATAALLFGDADREELVVPLAAMLVATVMHEVTYGYFRGLSDFKIGNAVRVLTVAVFPVALLAAAGDEPIDTLIVLMAVGMAVVCVAVMAAPIARAVRAFSASATRVASGAMLDYGYRRIPGDVAAVVLFSVPAVLAAHFSDLEGVAFLTTGMYVLSMMAVAFQPIGLVFLPLLSRLCASDFDAARRYVRVLAACSIHIALFVTPQLVLFSDTAVRAWLGPAFDDAGTIIAITVSCAGLYAVNVILRSALDAALVTAHNSRNNVISLVVAAVLVSASLVADVADPLNCIAWSFAIGVFCSGFLTLFSVHRVFGLQVRDYAVPTALALALLTLAAAIPVELAVGDDDSLGSVLAIGALEVALAGLYLAGLVKAGVTWPQTIRNQVRARA